MKSSGDILVGNEAGEIIQGKNSFDIIRYFLSFAVLIDHFSIITGASYHFFLRSSDAVHGFFILSGFLVFYSYIRKPETGYYTVRRARRILPPYLFIVTLCWIMGAFISSLSVGEYFSSSQFWKYLVANYSFLNFIQPALPGCFAGHAVNSSLWTLKVEILLYVTVPIVYCLMKRLGKFRVLIVVLLFSILYNELFFYLQEKTGAEIFSILRRQIGGQLIYFYSGTLIFLYFDLFRKYIKFLFPAAVFVCFFRYDIPLLLYFEPLAFATLLIGFAYYVKWFVFMRKFDNVAYGIYLFHFPVILFSVWLGIDEISIPLCFVFCVTGTLLLSILSWFLLEKPVLTNRLFPPKRK